MSPLVVWVTWLTVAMMLAAGLTGLTGCSRMETGAGLAALPAVRGPLGKRPHIEVPATRRPPERPRVRVLAEGSGPRVRPGEVVVTNVEIRVWKGGRRYLNTWETGQPTTVVLDGRHVARTWEQALVGRRAGGRVLLVAPAPIAFGAQGLSPAGVSPADTLIEVFDIIGGYRPGAQVTRAAGRTRPLGAVLPVVTVQPGREPEIRVPAGRPPEWPEVATLRAGRGERLRAGGTFVTNYTAVTWQGGRVFDSSYRRGGPTGFVLRPRTVPPGWERALTGVREGSRVLLVVPERLTRGVRSTLGGVEVASGAVVYVLDILDVR